MSDPVPKPVSQHTEYVFDQCNSLSVYFLVASILEALAFGVSWGMNLGDRFMRTTGGRESEAQVEARPWAYSVLPPVVMGVTVIIWGASTEKDMLNECREGLGAAAPNILWYYAVSLNLYMAGMSWVIIYSLIEGHRRRRLKRESKQKKVDASKRILDDMSPAGIVKVTTPSTEEEAVEGVALA